MIDLDSYIPPSEPDRLASSGLCVSKPINETNEHINCLHPSFITNPVLKDLIYQHRNYTFMGKIHYVSGKVARSFSHYFPKRFFRPSSNMTYEDAQQCYVTDFSSGEVFPMFILVPCGYCTICRGSRVDAFAHRCELETNCYNCLPYFVTLTYRNSCRPSNGLCVKDAQDFIKRLRSRLSYAGYKDLFRYVIVGEYGSNTHREHLHMLIWNLHPFKDHSFFKVRRIIRKSWGHGFIYLSIVSPSYVVRGSGHCLSKPENCFRYVAKYICKDCFVPEGKNPPFVNTSRRHGGIGAPFLDRHAPYIRKHLPKNFFYRDFFSNKVRSIVPCRYVLNRLFPTFCQSVPLELRNAVRFLCKTAPFVRNSDSYMDELQAHFKHLFWPRMKSTDCSSELSQSYAGVFDVPPPGACSIGMHEVWKNIQVLLKYKDFDFARSVELARCRSLFVSRLFEHKEVSYLLPIAKRRERIKVLSQSREHF